MTSVAEELRFNPRLGGDVNEADFVGHMDNLHLPHPKLIDIAVPANLRSGRPEGVATTPQESGWAPLTLTFGGLWEITPAALEERLAEVQLLDVREPAEFIDVLGHVPGARLLPLGQLSQQLQTLDQRRPIVTICRSGVRSAQAVTLLRKAGFERVANLAGGMLRWRAEQQRVEGAAQG